MSFHGGKSKPPRTFAGETEDLSYAYAFYNNTTLQSVNQLTTTTVLFNTATPTLYNSTISGVPAISYSVGTFTFTHECTVTVSYSIMLSSIALAGQIAGTYAVVTGSPADTNVMGVGYLADTTVTGDLYFTSTFTLKQSAGSTFRVVVHTANGTAAVLAGNLAASRSRISFLFHKINR